MLTDSIELLDSATLPLVCIIVCRLIKSLEVWMRRENMTRRMRWQRC